MARARGLRLQPLEGQLKKTLVLALVSLLLSLAAAEVGLRWLMFGSSELGASQRDPGLYADYFSEDLYWLLYHRFGGPHPPPERPHPVLGWVGNFSRDDYLHDDAEAVGDRRPVLLYGDSYAQCVEGETCFENLLNERPEFGRDHYLLNYAVGGYGLDQIYLLLRETVDLYGDPFVIVGLLTFDIDRSTLSVRTGQKPRFRIVDGRLVLDPSPIEPDPDDYFAAHPPRTASYLFRRFLYGDLLPVAWRDRLRGEDAFRREKTELGSALIQAIIDELEGRDLDYAFLVFHTHFPDVTELAGRDDWRDRLLRRLLDQKGVPYIFSKDVLAADMAASGRGPEAYLGREHRHPTTLYNRLIADEIERVVGADGA